MDGRSGRSERLPGKSSPSGVEVIRLVEVEFVLFTLAPAVVLFVGIVLSTLGIWRIGDYRLLLLTAVLMLMAQHQLLELFRFFVQGVVVGGGASEAIETGANVLATGAVIYRVRFAERQEQLRRKASANERRYRTITEQSPVPILVVRTTKYGLRTSPQSNSSVRTDGTNSTDAMSKRSYIPTSVRRSSSS